MSTLEHVAARFAHREIVAVGDEDDGTVFLACPAEGIDAARLQRLHEFGRGMVVLGLPEPTAQRLALPAPWPKTRGPREIALIAPIDAAAGIEDGWSARDRALTMRVAADPGSRSSDLTTPGHVYPALIGERPWSAAAAAIELAQLSGCAPAVALCAVVDRHGRAASVRHMRADERLRRLGIASPSELQSGWIARHAAERSVSCALPTRGGMFRAVGYAPSERDPTTVALIHGDPAGSKLPTVHVHVACMFGDAFGSLLCDCREELDSAAGAIERDGAGVIIYAKPEQPTSVGCMRDEPVDAALVAGLLRATGVHELRLLDASRRPRLRDELRTCGLTVLG